jgi:hypothetical protein
MARSSPVSFGVAIDRSTTSSIVRIAAIGSAASSARILSRTVLTSAVGSFVVFTMSVMFLIGPPDDKCHCANAR